MSEGIKNNRTNWVFDGSGQFADNSKWLFLYVNKHRPDINAVWVSESRKHVKTVRALGYVAHLYGSSEANNALQNCDVFVTINVKEKYSDELNADATILNLWHGVGCKKIEIHNQARFLALLIAKKNIKYTARLANHQLFLSTSDFMTEHFKQQMGLNDSAIVKADYPRTAHFEYPELSTMHTTFQQIAGLPDDTRVILYSPTYRTDAPLNSFSTAIPDLEELLKVLQKTNSMLVFKMHSKQINDPIYRAALENYAHEKRFLFWDNNLDIYEIMNQVDVAIVDYSSIFYDLLHVGISQFIRYFYDYDTEIKPDTYMHDVRDLTLGKEADTFDELLKLLQSENLEVSKEEIERIKDLFWGYAVENTNPYEQIIESALTFKPQNKPLPNLYTFDIFDTIFYREGVTFNSIFRQLQDRIIESRMEFPKEFLYDFAQIRNTAEDSVRLNKERMTDWQGNLQFEISLDEVYEQLKYVYNITDEQAEVLKQWEMEAEIDCVKPNAEMVQRILKLLDNGETVYLISDMYLPKSTIIKMLEKVDKRIAKLPLFLSSELGYQKTRALLFLQAFYHKFPYNFAKWIHTGDSYLADGKMPSIELAIDSYLLPRVALNPYEQAVADAIGNYDAYVFAGVLRDFRLRLLGATNDVVEFKKLNKSKYDKMRIEHGDELDFNALIDRLSKVDDKNQSANLVHKLFVCTAIAPILVPYVDWAVNDAIKRNLDTLYFISRDGHLLKMIADTIIEQRKLSIKTKYIYGSRALWQVPAMADEITPDFFAYFGYAGQFYSFDELLTKFSLTEHEFDEVFPELAFAKTAIPSELAENIGAICTVAELSKKYRAKLMTKAKEKRKVVLKYLQQEVDFTENYAFVEFWGRGYTQDCLTRILKTAGVEKTSFYYYRTILKSDQSNERINMSANDTPVLLLESIFGNMPYKTVRDYAKDKKSGEWKPVIVKNDTNNPELQAELEHELVIFAKKYSQANFRNRELFNKLLFEHSLSNLPNITLTPSFIKIIKTLRDSIVTNGKEIEYSREYTVRDFLKSLTGVKFHEQVISADMSIEMSSERMQKLYYFRTQTLSELLDKLNIRELAGKVKKLFGV
ncbi:MAG: CDP-glycerol glycerophosphotransferase family protein [Bifidobacteriaceae bacterium]|nr:CDP-glycerol glycerophosphotransferase family protein [Bifidobacteriaceae bacterium]